MHESRFVCKVKQRWEQKIFIERFPPGMRPSGRLGRASSGMQFLPYPTHRFNGIFMLAAARVSKCVVVRWRSVSEGSPSRR